MDEFIGVIKLFIGDYAPDGYLICDGRSLPVNQYQALFAVIGNRFGGNYTNFNLPDLRGRVPLGMGNGNGLTPRILGQSGGQETVALTVNNIPAHSHALNVSNAAGTEADPSGNYLAKWAGDIAGATNGETVSGKAFTKNAPNNTLNANAVANTGGGQPMTNMQPFLVMNYIICVQGLFPPRP